MLCRRKGLQADLQKRRCDLPPETGKEAHRRVQLARLSDCKRYREWNDESSPMSDAHIAKTSERKIARHCRT